MPEASHFSPGLNAIVESQFPGTEGLRVASSRATFPLLQGSTLAANQFRRSESREAGW